MDKISLHITLPVKRKQLINDWMNGEAHSKFTGGAATVSGSGDFTAWDGYIAGKTKSVTNSKIVQTWRTSTFAESDEDSIITLSFDDLGDETRLTLDHTNMPAGSGQQYHDGWIEHYFEPMAAYYSK